MLRERGYEPEHQHKPKYKHGYERTYEHKRKQGH